MTDRVIVGGVGYRNLRDHSAGVMVTDHLAATDLAHRVVVEDLSYSPVALVWRFLDETPETRFERAVFVTAVPRPRRAPGQITAYRWDGVLPDATEIQRCVADAITGIILIDNTLVVARHFEALPRAVAVVEVEPLEHEFGDRLSAPLAERFEELCEVVATLATDADAFARLPLQPLGDRPTEVFA